MTRDDVEEVDRTGERHERGALGPLGRVSCWVAARATHGDPPAVVATVARHRSLFRAWLPLATKLLRRTTLPHPDVELVILRTAVNAASWYEWAQHVPMARAAGLSADAIERVVHGPDAPGWTARQETILRATDQLHEHRVVDEATWSAIETRLGPDERLELCFLVGHYEMLAMTLNSLDVRPEPSAWARLAADARRRADELHARAEAARRTPAPAETARRTPARTP